MDEAGTSGNAQIAAAHAGAGGLRRRVFISYASHDAAVAQKVCSALEAAGFPCWIAPRNVVPGTLYADGIVHAIDDSSILILILSEQAIASAHVGREIERAVSKRHPVVALRIDAAPLTPAFEYFLNQSQWIEGGGSDAAIAQLVSAVGQHLAPGAETLPTHGIQASASHWKTAMVWRMWVIAAVVVAVLLAGGYLLDKAWRSKHETTGTAVISDKSVAVLPFVDMSEKKDQEYFSDGLSEELIDLLTKVPALRVPARTSSFYFKGKQATIADIAKVLGVAFVLEGSVRKSGNTLRVTAQLIKADAGFHVWSETYDRQLTDVFKVQDEIAEQVVKALKVSLLPRTPETSDSSRNIDANDLYLQAMFLNNHQTSEVSTKRSVELLSQALVLDPTFAPAWAALSRQKAFQAAQGLLPAEEQEAAKKDARLAAEKAVALNPLLPEARNALGMIYLREDEDAKASVEFRRALELNPRSSDALVHLGTIAGGDGRLDEQVKLQEQALAIDPLNVNILDRLGNSYLSVGNAAAAEAIFRRQRDLDPQSMFVNISLAIALAMQGRAAEALKFMEQASRDDAGRRWSRAMMYPALGRKAEADALLASLERDPGSIRPLEIAEVYAHRNNNDGAFEWLDRQYRVDPKVLRDEIHSDPLLISLREDARFKALLRKLNLPE